jgi:two-component system response regulator YesN
MVIRLEDGFTEYARENSSMIEYAVLSIVDELFHDRSAAWRCKDDSNYLVLPIKERARVSIEALGLQLQKNVKQYLKGNISIVVSDEGIFPRGLPKLYALSIAAMHRTIGSDNKIFLSLRAVEHPQHAHSLTALYAPPDLFRLMEAGRWEDAEKKIEGAFDELAEKWPNSQEHATEAVSLMLNSLSRIAHASGVLLADIVPKTGAVPFDVRSFTTLQRMRDWAAAALEATRSALERGLKDTRSALVKKVSSYIDENLHRDVSLQSIADFLDLHPAYVSRIYKLETGENLSGYILKRRMERAAYLLRSTDLKILEISTEIGYPNPAYFIKVFKAEFGMTPVEYRSADQRRPEPE